MSRVLEEVRRSLGRLASRTTVRDLPTQQSLQAVVTRSMSAAPLTAARGSWEDAWHPRTDIVHWPLPTAGAGGMGADLASVATIISANASLAAAAGPVRCPAWCITDRIPQMSDATHEILTRPSVTASLVRFGALMVRSVDSFRAAGDVRLIPVPRPALKKQSGNNARSWNFLPPRMQSDLRILARVPIFRDALASPPGQEPGEAFAAERRQLAASAQIEEADVLLLGVFPQVPLAMVEKLAVIAEGRSRLQIWLQPAALVAGPRGVKLATIILGRQRSTGRTLQAISRMPKPIIGDR